MYNVIENVLNTEVDTIIKLQSNNHHDDSGDHGSEGHFYEIKKDLYLPEIASIIAWNISNLDIKFHSVDPRMKLIKLEAPNGKVDRHIDTNFDGPDNSTATHSVIVYLNSDYSGGNTIFHDKLLSTITPIHSSGTIIVFPHNLPHEATEVTSGTKYVLKTDIFTLS